MSQTQREIIFKNDFWSETSYDEVVIQAEVKQKLEKQRERRPSGMQTDQLRVFVVYLYLFSAPLNSIYH